MSLQLAAVEKTVSGMVHLHPVTATLEPGLHVLLGPTGSGKTSLMRLMAGLDQPTAGRIVQKGEDVTGKPVRQRSVAFVYQQFINYPSLTVFENIASPLRLSGRSQAEIDAKVRETAGLLHIDHLLDRLPAELSGGQQQRTAIARALVKDADLLLLDEPLVNLDYKLREELRAELRALFERRDAVVVYSTTEPLEALTMGGSVMVMFEGRILQAGRTTEVYHHPASQTVSGVFSDPPMNLVGVQVVGDIARFPQGLELRLDHHLQGLSDGTYHFGIRAPHLSLRDPAGSRPSFPAEVDLADISGSETFVHVHAQDIAWVVQEEGVHEHELGQKVTVFLDPSRIYAFGADGGLQAAPPRPIPGGG
ncbi:MAG TPA: ABC transporter ATP-binding protein [Geminicoccus sp.]|jgi:glycerol transport system ATP-binding protein|uniref:ABC transporter ATP-binding protein n=1 Tax=Geminicoccus sp. TaxID=2024832 RepID=UPI002E331525|nr:ABC transporter ATP-binding protein [Geminicoccus sp.]HEX2529602.1 ABC transporter ATP-binding protein [Geminicoccus sp.]